jgi:hypothetical protein
VSRRSDSKRKKIIGFSPTTIIDTDHHLSSSQLVLLHRGPTYVPPCQMQIASSLPSNDILSKKFVSLRRHLAFLFSHYRLNIAVRLDCEPTIKNLFKEYFSTSSPLPLPIHQRALYEKKLVQSIRHQFKTDKLILRRPPIKIMSSILVVFVISIQKLLNT